MNLDTASTVRTLVADGKGILASAQAPTASVTLDFLTPCSARLMHGQPLAK
jgi:hypothetical protein